MRNSKFLYFFSVLLLLYNIYLFADDNNNNNYFFDKIKFQKQILIPEGISKLGDIKSQILKDKLYFIIINNKIFNKLYLFRYDLVTNLLDTFYIPLNNKYIYNFCINDKYLVINNDKNLTVFNVIKNQNTLSFKHKFNINIKVTYYQGTLKFIKDKLIAYGSDLSTSRLDQKTQTSLVMIDLEKAQKIKEYFFVNPEGLPMLWFQPRIVITANENNIIVSDIINYKFRLYNYDFELLNTFVLDSNFQEKVLDVDYKKKLDAIDIFSGQAKVGMEKLINLTGDISLIHRVEFINDSILLVLRSKPKGGFFNFDFYYDVYRVKGIKIECIYKDLILLDRASQIYPGKIEFFNVYQLSNGQVVSFRPIPFLLEKDVDSKELKVLTDDYYKNNEDIKASLFIHNFDF